MSSAQCSSHQVSRFRCDPASISPNPIIVQLLSRVRLFATPWIAACQASLSITNSRSLPRLIIESVMPSSHFILCRPFSSCPQSLPASGSFPMGQLFAWGIGADFLFPDICLSVLLIPIRIRVRRATKRVPLSTTLQPLAHPRPGAGLCHFSTLVLSYWEPWLMQD